MSWSDDSCGWPVGLPILDFGCNNGNLIRSSVGIIKQSDYTGIDIDLESIMEAKKNFPNATWLHYNRFNPLYNPNGNSDLPNIDSKFAAIFSYSVFTQMSMPDKFELIDHLVKNNLSAGGEMWFTFCNPHVSKCRNFFYNRRNNCDEIKCNGYAYLVDNKMSQIIPQEQPEHFIAFYEKDFLRHALRKYNPTFFDSPDGWVQDVIRLKP
jgi:SAM-dependent methyltransferase